MKELLKSDVDLLSHQGIQQHPKTSNRSTDRYCEVHKLAFEGLLPIKKAPPKNGGALKSGVDLLSHPQKGSTISANGLNFSVRNGKRWTSLQ